MVFCLPFPAGFFVGFKTPVQTKCSNSVILANHFSRLTETLAAIIGIHNPYHNRRFAIENENHLSIKFLLSTGGISYGTPLGTRTLDTLIKRQGYARCIGYAL